MKNVLLGLIVVLSLGLINCPTDNNEKDTRIVAGEYRGMYVLSHPVYNRNSAYEITKNKVIDWIQYNQPGNVFEGYRWSAWTVENELWVKGLFSWFDSTAPKGVLTEFKLGYFENDIFYMNAGNYINRPETYIKE